MSETSWSGLDATSRQAAELALLRLLDLEDQTRHSSRLHQYEGAALLARTAIDACITGMLCLYVPDAISRLNADNAQSLKNMMAYLADIGVLSEQAISVAVGLIGIPHRLESLDKLLEEVQKVGSPIGASQLYKRVYRPTSSFFAHGSGLAILRHVDRNDQIRDKPSYPWAKRSPAHTSDACVGLLAALLAGPEHPDFKLFSEFADWHCSRVAPVVMAIGGKGILQTVHVSRVPAAIGALRNLVKYFDSELAIRDSLDTRHERVREDLVIVFSVFGNDHDSDLVDSFVEILASIRSDEDATDASDNGD
ncbi:MAG: hypothetical protein ABSH04_08550, partial [Acidimicrobiales bacterium]